MNDTRRQKITSYGLGLTASALALYFLLTCGRQPIVFYASMFFLVICTTDTLRGRIPNLANYSLLLIGLWHNFQADGMSGLLLALAGLLTGMALLAIPYLMGGMGAGDVKALAALGALLGPGDLLQVFALTALVGGGMALLHLAASDHPLHRLRAWLATGRLALLGVRPPAPDEPQASSKIRYSYGPAIAFGFFAFILGGGLA